MKITRSTGHVRSPRTPQLAARTLRVNNVGELFVQFLTGDPVGTILFADLSFELAPLLLCPAELLRCRSEVQKVNGDDVGSGPQIGVTYEGVELTAGLRQPSLDGLESLLLLFGVDVSAGRSQSYSLGTRVPTGVCEVLERDLALRGRFLPSQRLERTTLVPECTSALSQ